MKKLIFIAMRLLLTKLSTPLGWRVGVWLSGPIIGLRKLRPHVELQYLLGVKRELWQRSRNDTSIWC